MKIIYKLLLSAFFVSAACVHTDARFIEQGKMWTYVVEHLIRISDGNTLSYRYEYEPFVCRIDGTVTIDGNEYAVVKAYFNDFFGFWSRDGEEYAYVREDADGNVYLIALNEERYPRHLCLPAWYDKEYYSYQ